MKRQRPCIWPDRLSRQATRESANQPAVAGILKSLRRDKLIFAAVDDHASRAIHPVAAFYDDLAAILTRRAQPHRLNVARADDPRKDAARCHLVGAPDAGDGIVLRRGGSYGKQASSARCQKEKSSHGGHGVHGVIDARGAVSYASSRPISPPIFGARLIVLTNPVVFTYRYYPTARPADSDKELPGKTNLSSVMVTLEIADDVSGVKQLLAHCKEMNTAQMRH
jgi:hypothetical protein